MYSKGEMYSIDAAFKITDVYKFVSAKRLEAGVYQIVVQGLDQDYRLNEITYTVNGKKASREIQDVTCEDVDCEASTNFSTSVSVSAEYKSLKFD